RLRGPLSRRARSTTGSRLSTGGDRFHERRALHSSARARRLPARPAFFSPGTGQPTASRHLDLVPAAHDGARSVEPPTQRPAGPARPPEAALPPAAIGSTHVGRCTRRRVLVACPPDLRSSRRARVNRRPRDTSTSSLLLTMGPDR